MTQDQKSPTLQQRLVNAVFGAREPGYATVDADKHRRRQRRLLGKRRYQSGGVEYGGHHTQRRQPSSVPTFKERRRIPATSLGAGFKLHDRLGLTSSGRCPKACGHHRTACSRQGRSARRPALQRAVTPQRVKFDLRQEGSLLAVREHAQASTTRSRSSGSARR